jgi:DNA-binding HxlR family transcriptional regulator
VRSYGQTCGVAKGLDVIGDRWTLLIVRELLIRGACRYTDLRNGLPGIATNLLAQRLRELEQAGIIYSEAAPPPVATTLFHLTPRGEALEPVLKAIGAWARPLLAEAGDEDSFQSHWLVLPLRFYAEDAVPDAPTVQIQLRPDGDEPIVVKLADGGVDAWIGTVAAPDLTLSGPARTVCQLMLGRISLADARDQGVRREGDATHLRRLRVRFQPTPESAAGPKRSTVPT